jgi:hypothetical protein
MLNVDRMSVAMLNIVMLSVLAPSFKNEKKVFFLFLSRTCLRSAAILPGPASRC